MTDWSQVVQEHGSVVWKTVRRIVGRDADAEDCFQNTFVSAIDVARTQRVDDWPALLKRLATRRALETLRRRYRKSEQMTGPLVQDPIDDGPGNPGNNVEERELAAALRHALTVIDEIQAEVFCMSQLEGWAYREIAQEMDISVNHVGVLLNRARSQLRRRLQAYHPSAGIETSELGALP